jgi:hypothetical protein
LWSNFGQKRNKKGNTDVSQRIMIHSTRKKNHAR